jgi:predicted ATPase
MLKHVKITNFKSLASVSLGLEPVTVLIGRSGTGKTNFVEALRFLRDSLTSRNPHLMQNYAGGWQRLISATAQPPITLSFLLRFTAPGVAEEYEYEIMFRQDPNQPHQYPLFREERLVLGSRPLFHQRENRWVHQPALLPVPQAGQVLLGALTGLPEVTIAYLVLTNGLGCYSFPHTVLQSNPNTPHVQSNVNGLSDVGDNFLQAYTAIAVNLQTWRYPKEIIACLRNLNPSVKTLDLQVPGGTSFVVGHEAAGRVLAFDLAQESEGFRRFLAHLIALYQNPSKQTLVFEEPEKGIHPGALATLADQFKACPDAGRGQVILTTHSPELLDHFEPEQLRVVTMRDNATEIGPVAHEQLEALREHLLRPGELLTVDAARMAPATAGE